MHNFNIIFCIYFFIYSVRFWFDLNQSQFEILNKFKEKIISENLCENPARYSDTFLLSYCRARKFELEKVYLMFSNYIKWRKENNVDDIEVKNKYYKIHKYKSL